MASTLRSEGLIGRVCCSWFTPSRPSGEVVPQSRSAPQGAGWLADASAPRLIVPFRHAKESLGPLRWAIAESRRTGTPLLVLHHAPIAVAVCNGPSASVAHQLGNPAWATVHSVAVGLGAPPEAVVIVESTSEDLLLERHWTDGSRIVVGSSSHRRRILRRLKRPLDVVQVSSGWVKRDNDADSATKIDMDPGAGQHVCSEVVGSPRQIPLNTCNTMYTFHRMKEQCYGYTFCHS